MTAQFKNDFQYDLQLAQAEAIRRNHQYLEPEHLFSIWLDPNDSNDCSNEQRLILKALETAGLQVGSFREVLKKKLMQLASIINQERESEIYPSPLMTRIFVFARDEAKKLKTEQIGGEHFILALLCDQLKGTSLQQMLNSNGLYRLAFERSLAFVYQKGKEEQGSDGAAKLLEKYCKNLTQWAQDQKLDPVIGRDEEIRRIIQVLSRRTKNNPILIGEPGVGKTALIEGLAQRIVHGDVPETLKQKKLFALDLAALIAGAKFRGEFEERLKGLVKEVITSNGSIILFIDEIHTLVGAGSSDGAMDASNMLKPTLARGDLRCVGATTLKEYKKYIEKDAALERRFQPVFVKEPSLPDTISILRGLREKYEVHHGVSIRDSALVAAATLSNRYLTERFLPDKAIDLVDEAASMLRMEIDSRPEQIDQLARKVLQLEVERQALKKEKDQMSEERLIHLELELKALKEENDILQAQWEKEKQSVDLIKNIKEKMERVRIDSELAERRGDLEKAAELRYGNLTFLKKELNERLEQKEKNTLLERPILRQEVTENDIAEVVSRWTGIPVSKMLEVEQDKLLKMEERLGRRVIGQEKAIAAIANAVRRSRVGLREPYRPIGSFLFLGPTGVGKTETAKALAEFLFNDDSAMIRLDMSEYTEKHSVARLVGSPPGYVGYDEGGLLIECIRRRPYSIILLDEIEKAHPDVFHIFLQILDDGRATDGQGRTASFSNTVIIMTSNVGSDLILSQGDVLLSNEELMKVLKSEFRPEFLNRIDEIVVFSQLEMEQLKQVALLYIDRLNRMMRDHGINLVFSPEALDFLCHKGYSREFGARPIKRVFQTDIQNQLASYILNEKFSKGTTVRVDILDGQIQLNHMK